MIIKNGFINIDNRLIRKDILIKDGVILKIDDFIDACLIRINKL